MKNKLLKVSILFVVLATVLIVIGCAPLLVRPERVTQSERLSQFPIEPAPISAGVSILWNKYSVPFIKAETDTDAAFALGTIHAHLRWGQIELLRRLASGRLSEMAGPFTQEIDHALRILDLDKAAPALIENMEPDTREWAQAFVAGLNWYMRNSKERPLEFTALDLEYEPWTLGDLVKISRLAGTDINWIFYVSFLRQVPGKKRDELWKKYLSLKKSSPASFGEENLSEAISRFSKSGSNSIAIGGSKTASGAALIANDPHLGIFLPNFWLLAAVESPSYNVVGMMIPGVPFFALGRNQHIAWGGTNMRAVSSHLFKLEPQQLKRLKTRTETIDTRWWFDKDIEVRDSELGPVFSDAPFVADSNEAFALYWTGHRPDSDEFSAFLAVNRAKNFEEFREAFRSYSVSSQNMLYADREGNVGMVLAYRQPQLKNKKSFASLIKSADDYSADTHSSIDLPYAFNPKEGFIASANNLPTETELPLAYTYATPDRFNRLQAFGRKSQNISTDDLKNLQLDVYSESSHQLAKQLQSSLIDTEELSRDKTAFLLQALAFDGFYSLESRGAVAFEILMSSFAPAVLKRHIEDESYLKAITRGGNWKQILRKQLSELDTGEITDLLLESASETYQSFKRYPDWQSMHRQLVQHPLGNIPLIGKRYQVIEYGALGGNDTLMKSGHRLSGEKHRVTYGAQSRHISDMSDPDENLFVLLGGQDGWLFSDNTSDQIPLWRNGGYIRVPLRSESFKESSVQQTDLQKTTARWP